MPATIRHWMSARPVTLAGIITAMVTMPPTLVTKPWAPAIRTLFSITSWIARSTLPRCSRELLVGRLRGRRERADAVDGAVERLAHEAAGQAGCDLGDPRGELSLDGLLQAHATDRTGAGARSPAGSPGAGSHRRGDPCGWVVR